MNEQEENKLKEMIVNRGLGVSTKQIVDYVNSLLKNTKSNL